MRESSISGAIILLGSLLASPDASAQQCMVQGSSPALSDTERKSVVYTADQNGSVLAGFKLSRTLDNILITASGGKTTPDAAQREALLESLLIGLRATTLTNVESGLTFPVQPRPGESALTAKELLSAGPDEMVPVGLFNRLDLTPDDYTNCGEYRIVYAKKSAGGGDRFFLIFEAALTNPAGAEKSACQQVAQFWRDLRSKPDVDAAALLEKFYYEGGALAAGGPAFEPVVDYRHYGIPTGQVRGNAFVNPAGSPWHLRQWKTAIDQTGAPSFVVSAVGENPVPAFFGEDLTSGATPPDAYRRLSAAFKNQFLRGNVGQLIDVDRSAAIPGDPNDPSITDEELINKLGVHIDSRYYAVESAADSIDNPSRWAGSEAQIIADIAAVLKDSKMDKACGLTPEHVLNRMGAMTCGGCHEFSNGVEIAPSVNWPSSARFVHIKETGELSDLLINHFLTARFAMNERVATGNFPWRAPQISLNSTSLRTQLATLLAKYQRSYAARRDGEVRHQAESVADLVAIERLSDALRQIDQEKPGAFVFFRKPD